MIDTVSTLSPKRSKSSPNGSPELRVSHPKAEVRHILASREQLLPEVGRMVRLGRLLRSRIKEPLVYQR